MSWGGGALRPLPWSHHYLQTEILDSQVMELNICRSLLFHLCPVNLINPTYFCTFCRLVAFEEGNDATFLDHFIFPSGCVCHLVDQGFAAEFEV